jgi:alkane 1-monooxygenase
MAASTENTVKKFSRKAEMLRFKSTSPLMKMLENFYVSPWPFYSAYVVVCVFFYGYARDEFWYLPWIIFSVIPLLDILLPADLSYPENDKDPSIHSIAYKLPLWGMAIVSTAVLYLGCSRVASGEPLSFLKYLQLAFSVGLGTGGLGITVSHELFHKPSQFDKLIGTYLLVLTSYMHFVNEHLHGHHLRVATPEDPASAVRGQSFYNFYLQSVIGSWKSSWEMEVAELQKNNKPIWSVHNKMLWYLAIPFCFAICLSIWFGSLKVFIFFYIQAWMGFSLLETTNYIEHYGLSRQQNADGTYEPVKPTHSWNAPQAVSNFILFRLQRHSDHHAYALRPYQLLRNFVDSPYLPTGYSGMIVLALFPPLYFKIMDNRIEMTKKLEAAIAKRALDDTSEVSVVEAAASTHLNTSTTERAVLVALAIVPSIFLLL